MPSKSAIHSTNVAIYNHHACKLRSSKLFSDVVANTNPFSVLISHQHACEHNAEHYTNAHKQLLAGDFYTSNLFYCYAHHN